MTRYISDGRLRVAILPTVTTLTAPTVAELNAGTVISGELAKDGLEITRSTSTTDRTPWKGDLEVEAPTRYKTSVSLTAARDDNPAIEWLWTASATFRAQGFLVVRRGLAHSTAWAAGQKVEVLAFRYGKRSTFPSASNQAARFTVTLVVTADTDAGVVAA